MSLMGDDEDDEARLLRLLSEVDVDDDEEVEVEGLKRSLCEEEQSHEEVDVDQEQHNQELPSRERARTESVPSLEWEASDRGSVDLTVSSRNTSVDILQDSGNTIDENDVADDDKQSEMKWTSNVPEFPSPPTSEVLAELNGPRYLSRGSNSFDFYLGLRKIHVSLQEYALTYFVRPDVTADSVFYLIEQIMLSFGSKCLATLPVHIRRELLFQPTHPSNSSWQEIRVYLGVNSTKKRVLVVILKPSVDLPKGLLVGGLSMAAGWGGMGLGTRGSAEDFDTFVTDIEASFTRSLNGEQLTIGYLHQHNENISSGLNSLTTLAKQQSMKSSTSPPVSLTPLPPLESLLDPYFVRELQEAFIRDTYNRLNELMISHLDSIETLEKQCARLMTLLRPFFVRCDIKPPTPPGQSASFTKFVNDGRDRFTNGVAHDSESATPCNSLSEVSIHNPTLESSKLLILRARRTYLREKREETLDGFSSDHYNIDASVKHRSEVYGVLQLMYSQLRGMCEVFGEEYSTALSSLMMFRRQDVENFRWKLVECLVNRTICTSEDKEVWAGLKGKFRVASASDPYIIDFRATMSSMLTDTGVLSGVGGTMSNNNRSGTVYITHHDIFFASTHIPLLGVVQKVIPIRTIKNFTTTDATMLSNGTLSIVDTGDNTTTFWISSAAPNYAGRVGDLLRLLMPAKEVCSNIESKPDVAKSKVYISETTSTAIVDKSPNADLVDDEVKHDSSQSTTAQSDHATDILILSTIPEKDNPIADSNEVVSFQEEIDAAIARSRQPVKAATSPLKTSTTTVDEDPFAGLAKAMLDSKTFQGSSKGQKNSTVVTANDGKIYHDNSTASAPPSASNKMAMGIQAFLDQQRQQSKKK